MQQYFPSLNAICQRLSSRAPVTLSLARDITMMTHLEHGVRVLTQGGGRAPDVIKTGAEPHGRADHPHLTPGPVLHCPLETIVTDLRTIMGINWREQNTL